MKKKHEPLYATISLNGAIYAVSFRVLTDDDGTKTTCCLQGYSERTFDEYRGSGIPLIDFRTMDFKGYTFPTVRERVSHWQPSDPTFEEYLADVRKRGATITTL